MTLNSGEQRRRLGREIRRRRNQARLSQGSVSESLACAQTTVSSWERGTRLPKVDDLARLDGLFNTGGSLVQFLHVLEEDSYGYPSWSRDFVAAEADASEIRSYQPLVVPGLLQTPEYSRAQIRIGQPTAPTSSIDELVKGREKRQKLVASDGGPLISAIVEEHVLRRPLGGWAVLRGQLTHLLDVAESPRITLQAVPMDSEVHFGMDGSFILLKVPNRGQMVYRETRVDSSPREDSEALETYFGLFAALSAHALTPDQSCGLIDRIRSEINDGRAVD
ncbi:helix-turn-helix transcriptional regulator [Spiractinospora alimapuensis]|uniref:helix-turn-helix domain-containing protein n=1 Tax=Spiractinospora alimapuensis TaxID=2820884 RepID=UPI0022AA1D13|nr:helix-turn-helix transcriptional regulator [Spiractinospora alimapuensis]QVQ54178.1 helix-turn-helix transcriptional regulator [Spiractinospora alimapuensis]